MVFFFSFPPYKHTSIFFMMSARCWDSEVQQRTRNKNIKNFRTFTKWIKCQVLWLLGWRKWQISGISSLNPPRFRKDKGKGQHPIHGSLWRPALRSRRQTENTRRRLRTWIPLMHLRWILPEGKDYRDWYVRAREP